MSGHNTPGKGPNEGGKTLKGKNFDSMSNQKKREIMGVLKDNAEKIDLPGGADFDEAVNLLLKKKEEGVNCFINFNGTKIFSADTNTVDDAYLQYIGMTKAESEERSRKYHEQLKTSERERKEREKGYIKKIEDSREGKEEIIITKDAVVKGLKFIAEHPDMEQNQLIDELIALGCNFTFEDIKNQFPDAGKLFPGMKHGDIAAGASIIANYMSSEFGRSYVDDRFLSGDYEESVYAFIRTVTGDETYTKEYVDSLISSESSK